MAWRDNPELEELVEFSQKVQKGKARYKNKLTPIILERKNIVWIKAKCTGAIYCRAQNCRALMSSRDRLIVNKCYYTATITASSCFQAG